MKKIVAVAAILFVMACKENKPEGLIAQEFVGNAIGTTYSIKAFSESPLEITKQVDSIITAFNNSMSTWQETSDINKFNNGENDVQVTADFKEVYDAAQEIYRKTDGYFDPTVGNLVNAYGFGAKGEQTTIPSQQQIDSLLQFVGFYHLNLEQAANPNKWVLSSTKQGMYLEFNAIAKGTLVDHIAKLLDSNGATNYVVEVGGEVITKGSNLESNAPWAIGIDDPNQKPDEERRIVTVVNLTDKAMAGSGNYRKIKTDVATGKVYAHTVNPTTGIAQPSNVIGVNVIANTCTMADGYATAFMAMPLEKSRELLPNIPDIEVLIMYIDDNGLLKFETTPGFKQYIKVSL